jgi:hypothetical protein
VSMPSMTGKIFAGAFASVVFDVAGADDATAAVTGAATCGGVGFDAGWLALQPTRPKSGTRRRSRFLRNPGEGAPRINTI